MQTLIRLEDGAFAVREDPYVEVGLEGPLPEGPVLLPLSRFQIEGAAGLDDARKVGVRLEPSERVEDLVYDLPRIALVALAFPKFRDGRAYSAAALLRGRYAFQGEVRAVGDVLREQAFEMVRCGFDGFAPADGSTAEAWAAAAGRYRHVYQVAADGRPPAFLERRG